MALLWGKSFLLSEADLPAQGLVSSKGAAHQALGESETIWVVLSDTFGCVEVTPAGLTGDLPAVCGIVISCLLCWGRSRKGSAGVYPGAVRRHNILYNYIHNIWI